MFIKKDPKIINSYVAFSPLYKSRFTWKTILFNLIDVGSATRIHFKRCHHVDINEGTPVYKFQAEPYDIYTIDNFKYDVLGRRWSIK